MTCTPTKPCVDKDWCEDMRPCKHEAKSSVVSAVEDIDARVSEIEDAIAAGRADAAWVFTQMRQLVSARPSLAHTNLADRIERAIDPAHCNYGFTYGGVPTIIVSLKASEWRQVIKALRTPSPVAHIDHPARHFDRTCPACIAEGTPAVAGTADWERWQKFPSYENACGKFGRDGVKVNSVSFIYFVGRDGSIIARPLSELDAINEALSTPPTARGKT